jgi:hypothetical protein
MSSGFLYCFSNSSMPGILKIGMTERTPDIRLAEANSSDTWRPPTLYKIEFAKKVLNPKQKENIIHMLLSQYTERINPKREFFKVTVEEVKIFFDLMDGDNWIINKNEDIEKDDESEDGLVDDITEMLQNTNVKGSRDMTKCFVNGQRIKHTIGINKTWIGVYDSIKNAIIYDNKIYKSLSGFAQMHYNTDKPDRISVNGWRECECEINKEWVSTYNL